MNFLICSAGRRSKLIRYFREQVNKIGGIVVAADCDASAPALHLADKAELVPRISHPDYLKQIKHICQKHKINAVLSLIDPELSLLAEHKEELANENVQVIVSNIDVINICYDKYQTYQFLQKHNLPAVPTYVTLEDITTGLENFTLAFPIIIKPKNGSASLGISTINSLDELYALWNDNGEFIAQPFIDGDEYGIDAYVDLITGHVTNIFCKRKIRMRAGETDKSVSVNDPQLVQLIKEVINKLNPVGPIDIDCFKTTNGYVISEINPRFGGGYPHAHEEGQNFVNNMINNLTGKVNTVDIGNYNEGSVMIKFDDVMILRSLDLISQSTNEGIACTK